MSTMNQQEKSVAESEEKFRLLLDGVKDHDILLLDTNGIITSWDRGPSQKESEVLGQHVSHFYPAEDVASGKPERDLAEALAKGRFEHEGWRLRNDGTRFWAEIVTTALKDKERRLRGYSIVQRDVTERKRSETALQSVVDHSRPARITGQSEGLAPW